MNRFITLFVFMLFAGGTAFAQPPKGEKNEKRREEIRAEKIAFISTQLKLTPEEAQNFWPIYNQYEADIDANRAERKKYHRELRKSKKLDGDRAYELFELIFETEKKASDIRLKYLEEFSKVLGKEKAAQVFIAEERFKRELLKRIKEKGETPPPPGDHPQH